MTGFYVLEAQIHRGFVDPVGPADEGWLAQPSLALCQIEALPTSDTILRASDTGYRSRASDPQGVQSYPPRIVDAFQVDVSVNLDPTASSIGASWGNLTLANADGFYDALIADYQIDGRPVSIYRGEKVWDAARGLAVDPPWSSLRLVFAGVMGPAKPDPQQITIPLFDASYYLAKPFPRTLYGGTGGKDGTAALAGVSKPFALGGAFPFMLFNVTPQSVDPANLVYHFGDNSLCRVAYDGGVPLGSSTLIVADVYTATPPAAGFCNADHNGYLQLGLAPLFQLTGDVDAASTFGVVSHLYALLTDPAFCAIPTGLVSTDGAGHIQVCGADASWNTLMAGATLGLCGVTLAAGEAIDGIATVHRLIAATGGILASCRDGKLRLFFLFAIPSGSSPVLAFDDTNIVSIQTVDLPSSIDPPPWRMRVAGQRNWTVQASNVLAAGITADRATQVSQAAIVEVAVSAPPTTAFGRANDPAVIGLDGGSCDLTGDFALFLAQRYAALWGSQRRQYEIACPVTVGLDLDFGSIVSVTTGFDGLQGGKLGQIVGWHYSSGDATATFRVLV